MVCDILSVKSIAKIHISANLEITALSIGASILAALATLCLREQKLNK
jgi:hypothetical protein